MNDSDHAAVYAAELAAFDGTDLEELRDFESLTGLIAEVADGNGWWPGGPVEVLPARSDAHTSSTRCVAAGDRADSVIRLATSQLTIATAAHELAHALAGTAHQHDAVYRQAYLDVVFVMTNLDTTDRRHDLHVDQLAEAFRAERLTVGPRCWAPPPPSAGSAFAL